MTQVTLLGELCARFKAPISMFFLSPLPSPNLLPSTLCHYVDRQHWYPLSWWKIRHILGRDGIVLSRWKCGPLILLSRQTHMPLLDTLSLIALWHAGGIKGGIFHLQLESKIKTMKCGEQREDGGSEGGNERWLEVSASANELQAVAETNSSW